MEKRCFSGMIHSNLPDLDASDHLWRMPNITQTSYPGWTDPQGLPTQQWFDALATAQNPTRKWIQVDHEVWPVGTQTDRQQTAHKFLTLHHGIKTVRPDLKVCFYGMPTLRNTWECMSYPSLPGVAQWRASNNDIGAILAPVLDAYCPSVYWYYDRATDGDDVNDLFQRYIRKNIEEAQRIRAAYGNPDQPILPYIWWRRYGNQKDLDLDIWQDMVRIAYREGDGFILWGGYGPDVDWNVKKPWWDWLQPRLPKPHGMLLTEL